MKKTPPRYIAEMIDNGLVLRDQTTKTTIHAKEFSLTRRGRIEMLDLLCVDGSHKKVARWTVDETAFSFGPHVTAKGKQIVGARDLPRQVPQRTAVLRMISLTIPRDSAVQLLQSLRAVESQLMQKLIEETLETTS